MSDEKINDNSFVVKEKILDIFTSSPKDFFIVIPSSNFGSNDKIIPIINYDRFEVIFSNRVEFYGGEKNIINYPMITYFVNISSNSRNDLSSLFRESIYGANRMAKVKIGKNGHVFKVMIQNPGINNNFRLDSDNRNFRIKIDIDLKDLEKEMSTMYNVDFFEKNGDNEESNRFEIMDL